MKILGDIVAEFVGIADELRNSINDTVTLTVAKPYCSPARPIIKNALEPYGVKIHSIREKVINISLLEFSRRMQIELKTRENLKYGAASVVFLPMSIEAKVTVNSKAAAWAEYLMLRTGKLYVPGRYYEPKNYEWAKKHGGVMPPQWEKGEPWIEKMCSKGIEKWQEAKAEFKPRKPTLKEKLLRSLK